MHNLTAITPLGAQSARVDTISGATLRENTNLALASLHARLGQEPAVRKKLKALLGADTPKVGKAVFAAPFNAIWTGADQWLISAPYESHEEMGADLAAQFAGIASVTEQSDAWAIFDLSGEGIKDVMELLCSINMRSFKQGDAARTSIHHLGCFVVHLPDQDGLRVIGPRASAGSLHHALVTAMHSAL